MLEVVYTAPFEPDWSRALDVLAFVLMPVRAFVETGDGPDAAAAVANVLGPAKARAIAMWFELNRSKP